MEYNISKTYSENLSNLLEQPDSKMPFQPERFGYKQNDYKTLRPALEKQQQSVKDTIDFIKEHRHGILAIASLAALTIPLAGPFISLGLELVDAGLYASEGDKYMAGFTLAFSLIPGSQIAMKIPAVKQLSKQGLVRILKFFEAGSKSKIVLSRAEKLAAEEIAKNSKWIKRAFLLNLVKNSIKLLIRRMTLRQYVKFILKWKRSNKIKSAIAHTTIQIAGITYTYDKLAKMLGINEKGEDVAPTVSVKTQSKLENNFQKEKPKTVEQLSSDIEENLTSEESLKELQKLMDESLKEDRVSINPIKPIIPVKNNDTVNKNNSVNTSTKAMTSGNDEEINQEQPIKTNTTVNNSDLVSTSITGLKNVDEIKKFQDWLDINHIGWATGYKDGILNKGQYRGGYGKFGPRTSKAWNNYKDEYLKTSNSDEI
jgi:hypothetical protein